MEHWLGVYGLMLLNQNRLSSEWLHSTANWRNPSGLFLPRGISSVGEIRFAAMESSLRIICEEVKKVKRLLLILVVGLVFIAGSLFSVRPTPLISEALEEKRFKIYFSPHLRSDTFLVDGEVGTVYVLTKSPEGKMAWTKMMR